MSELSLKAKTLFNSNKTLLSFMIKSNVSHSAQPNHSNVIGDRK